MQFNSRLWAARSLRTALAIAGITGVLAGTFAWYQAEAERATDTEDIDRRARAIAHVLSYTVHDALLGPPQDVASRLGKRLDGHGRLVGCAVFGPEGNLLAAGAQVREFEPPITMHVSGLPPQELDYNVALQPAGQPLRMRAERLLHADGSVSGTFVVVHDISFIDQRVFIRLLRSLFWIVMSTFLLIALFVITTWAIYDRPLQHLADWMQRLRTEDASELPPQSLPSGRLASETRRLAASFRAVRHATFSEASRVAVMDKSWNRDRLRAHALDCLGIGSQLISVSSREPYMHTTAGDIHRFVVPPGGVVTALDPVLQACGGVWIAHGTGDADRETADAAGRVAVPPGDPRYTLRRIWMSKAENDGYYGCCNDAIWPMCLQAHERPVFRTSDWAQYVAINQRFADAVLDEAGAADAVVLVQDYQMALVPRMVKRVRPDLRVCLFWHIPWPSIEAVRICPWREEIIDGILGADLVGFHLQQYCNQFLDTIDRMVEARVDRDHGAVQSRGHITLVRPQPISVQPWHERGVPAGDRLDDLIASLRTRHQLEGIDVAVGVDRVDHTKGLPERFRAFAHFLRKYPAHRGRVSLVQLAAPSRIHLKRYRDHLDELVQYAEQINEEFGSATWKPIHLLVSQHDATSVHAWLTMAGVAIVSSLHDGMNLVAKEYVLAQDNLQGCLILSEFAGAAQELSEALIINPYDTEQFADAIRYAVEMPADERAKRMRRLRQQVEQYNIYRWAAGMLADIPPPRNVRRGGESAEVAARLGDG
jgi:trehalose-6-phosphate synthase/HAMP domain-containing protein